MPINSVAKIKKSITRSDKLLESGVPIHLDQTVVKNTNCYAYAMGITYSDIPIGQSFYVPGFTEKEMYDVKSSESLVRCVEQDLENIGIKFKRVQLEEKVELRENEYLVKLFYTPPSREISTGDFHFVRQDRKSGKWFHKMGWTSQPALIRSDSKFEQVDPGLEPSTIVSHSFLGDSSWTYTPVCYFIITES